jgi:murein DD-endopeptidase MepM/ murein hydrolase activator NlpD
MLLVLAFFDFIGTAFVLTVQRYRFDSLGDGTFGSNRHGHKHDGVDLVADPGTPVFSPVAGYVVRLTYPYPGDERFHGVVLKGLDGLEVKLFYVLPSVAAGDRVALGQRVGTAEDVRAKYGDKMQAHVHVEYRQHGEVLDPSKYLHIV